MTNSYEYRYGIDNIFDFHFMDDFTTVAVAMEENIDISDLKHTDQDDFYSYSEHRAYNEAELFEKFNIKKIA